MTIPTLVQFTKFISSLDHNAFKQRWAEYAKTLQISGHISLLRQVYTRSRYAFISKRYWPVNQHPSSFTGDTKSFFFPDKTAKVVEAGAYMETADSNARPGGIPTDPVVFAFVKKASVDFVLNPAAGISACREYQPCFESCAYKQVFEITVAESHLPTLLLELRRKEDDMETAAYLPWNMGQAEPATA